MNMRTVNKILIGLCGAILLAIAGSMAALAFQPPRDRASKLRPPKVISPPEDGGAMVENPNVPSMSDMVPLFNQKFSIFTNVERPKPIAPPAWSTVTLKRTVFYGGKWSAFVSMDTRSGGRPRRPRPRRRPPRPGPSRKTTKRFLVGDTFVLPLVIDAKERNKFQPIASTKVTVKEIGKDFMLLEEQYGRSTKLTAKQK